MKMYNKFRKKHSAGAGLMVVGSLFIIAAFAMGAAAGATGEEGIFYAAVGVEIFGDFLFFPGLAVMITGKVGMGKAKAGKYSHQAALRIPPLVPRHSAADGSGARSGGLGLTFSF